MSTIKSTEIFNSTYYNLELKTLDNPIHGIIIIDFPYSIYQHTNKNRFKSEIIKLLETFLYNYPNYKLINIITDKNREYTLSTLHLLLCTNYFSKVTIHFKRMLAH
jgi:hypothetical protein